MSALYQYGRMHPAKTRRARIVWGVAMLVNCVPMSVFLVRGAILSWRDVLSPPDLPPWLESQLASPWDAFFFTLVGLPISAFSAFLVVALVRMVVLGWDGPTWKDPG